MQGLKDYESVAEVAKRLGIDDSRVKRLIYKGRIPGAFKIGEGRGSVWLIPKGVRPIRSQHGPAASWAE